MVSGVDWSMQHLSIHSSVALDAHGARLVRVRVRVRVEARVRVRVRVRLRGRVRVRMRGNSPSLASATLA